MARYSIDSEGVSRERFALADDPVELRECASLVAVATAGAVTSTGTEGGCLRADVSPPPRGGPRRRCLTRISALSPSSNRRPDNLSAMVTARPYLDRTPVALAHRGGAL